MKINLTQGRAAEFDDTDIELISKYTWWAALKRRNGKFYAQTKVNGKNVMMHRLIMNAQSGQIVDHKNGNTLDNRRENLRFATHADNQHNQDIAKHNSSGFKGVSFYKLYDKWRARIKVNGKEKLLGYFDTPLEAACAYDKAAIEFHGDFAKTNKQIWYGN